MLLVTPAGALIANSATFATSAALIWRGVRPRPAPESGGAR
ncbi:hypothetical protein [Nonomuraea mesophila]|nr:hypothetical protein [Nonomuraea mesophila]